MASGTLPARIVQAGTGFYGCFRWALKDVSWPYSQKGSEKELGVQCQGRASLPAHGRGLGVFLG